MLAKTRRLVAAIEWSALMAKANLRKPTRSSVWAGKLRIKKPPVVILKRTPSAETAAASTIGPMHQPPNPD